MIQAGQSTLVEMVDRRRAKDLERRKLEGKGKPGQKGKRLAAEGEAGSASKRPKSAAGAGPSTQQGRAQIVALWLPIQSVIPVFLSN